MDYTSREIENYTEESGMTVGHTVQIDLLPSRYQVEIRHPGRDWSHVHPPSWERTTLLVLARRYALQVQHDEPEAQVRVVRIRRGRCRTFATGEVRDIDLVAEVV
jgi:hypothetical protein